MEGVARPRRVQPVTTLTFALAAAVTVEIAVLVAMRAGAVAADAQLLVQAALALCFACLALVDLRAAVAISVLELVVGGGSGRWTELPLGVSGRMLLDGILGVASLLALGVRRARTGRLELGRYGLHAAAIALVIPLIWVPVGLINGNSPGDVLADADGFLFFGFALVLAAVALRGDLAWLRRWLLVACLAEALVTLGIAAAAVGGLASARHLNLLLAGLFDSGGQVRLDPSELRVYMAGGLFLQIGVAIGTWEIVRKPRRILPWLAVAVLGLALLVTFTRGYWLGAFICAAIVVAFGRSGAGSIAISRRGKVLLAGSIAAAAVVFTLVEAGGGMESNVVKLVQAGVLLNHALERPWIGWGFGAIAHDYTFGAIFSYEITYLDRAFKLGFLGLALFLSLPVRLVFDSYRVLRARLPGPPHMDVREGAVPLAILLSVLVASATNPYLAGSVGIGAVILTIAWLDPFEQA